MQMPSALALVCTLAISVNAFASDGCDRAGLLNLYSAAPELAAAPIFPKQQAKRLRRFVLHDSPLVMDGYKYKGVVDLLTMQAWMLRYGGIAGLYEWRGPVPVAPDRFAACTAGVAEQHHNGGLDVLQDQAMPELR
jgi:hypothetical protein